MKVAIVTDAIYPFTIGGSEIRNYEIAKRLIKRGYEVHIYGGKFWEGKDKIEKDGVKIHGVSKYTNFYNKEGKRKPLESIILSLKLFFKLIKEDYDIIDNASFVFFNCYTTKLVSLTKRKPLVFTWHQYFGNYLAGYFGQIKGTIAKILERFSVYLAKNNLAVSKSIKEELIRKGIKPQDIKVIYNGVNLEEVKKTKPLKEEYDLIFVGRLNYQKNLSLLIKSISLIKKEFPKIKACIIGEGEEKNRLGQLVKNLNLEENIEFLGKKEQKEVFQYMKSSKIFVLPSILEGFPLTIVEANACGLPIITAKTKYNNTKEYIKDNINGLIIKPIPREFGEAIKNLLKNNKLRKKMSKEGIKIAKEFDWNYITEQVEEYYKNVINKTAK